MLSAKSGAMFQQSAERDEPPRTPLHNVDEAKIPSDRAGEESPSNASQTAQDGTWGERDVGGPINFQGAMQEFEDLRNELSHLSKTRTQKTEDGRKHASLGLRKTNTNTSRRSRTADLEAQDKDTEAYGDDKELETERGSETDDFELGDFLREGHFEKRDADKSAKKIGVVYKNLTVQGVGATAVFVKTLPGAVLGVSVAFSLCFNNRSICFNFHYVGDIYPVIPASEQNGDRCNCHNPAMRHFIAPSVAIPGQPHIV